jgi:hypothetical protein
MENEKLEHTCKFEMDCYGNFRIIVDGIKSEPSEYHGIANLEFNNKRYIAVSDFFKGIIPTETVIEVTVLPTESEDAIECNMFRPDDECTHSEQEQAKFDQITEHQHYEG